MQAVMILKGADPSWAEAKRQLGDQNFIKSLVNFDKDNISDRVLKKIGQYCAMPDFLPETVGRVSGAAQSLCLWVSRLMALYAVLQVTITSYFSVKIFFPQIWLSNENLTVSR